MPAVLKNSSILRIAPLLCPNIHEKGAGVLQEADIYEQNKSGFDSFAAIIRKYVGI